MQKGARKRRAKILITAQSLDNVITSAYVLYFIIAPLIQFFLYKQSNEFLYNTALYVLITLVFPLFLFRTILSEKRNIVSSSYTFLIMLFMLISFIVNINNLEIVIRDLIIVILALIALNTFKTAYMKNKIETAVVFSLLAMSVAMLISPLTHIADTIYPVAGLGYCFWKLMNFPTKSFNRKIGVLVITIIFCSILLIKFSILAFISLTIALIASALIYYISKYCFEKRLANILTLEKTLLYILVFVLLFIYPISKTLAGGVYFNPLSITSPFTLLPLVLITIMFFTKLPDKYSVARYCTIIILLLGGIIFPYTVELSVLLSILLIIHVAPQVNNSEEEMLNKNKLFQAGILGIIIFSILFLGFTNFVRAEYLFTKAESTSDKCTSEAYIKKAVELNPFNDTYKAAVSNSSGCP